MKRTAIRIAAALALGAFAASATAAGDAAAGKAKIGTCMACHGNNGKGLTPEYPNLCGQNEKYLVSALKAYKDGSRNNPIMKPMAAMLADADVENVAAYYAAQKCN
jgi:cytochrome c553